MAIKVKLDQKDPKKHVVKFSTSKDDAAVGSVYVSNAAVEKLGDPDSITLTISGEASS
jgi:hypothetical protein